MKKKNRFKEVKEYKGFKIGDTIHIQRWYYGEDTREFLTHRIDNSIMVDVKLPIDKITIDEETGKDTLWCGKFSTSTTDIGNKGLVECANPTIHEFILHLLNKKIPVNGVSIVDDLNVLGYDVPGFSKSGNVTLFEANGKIFASARYNETTEITCFDDLVSLAFDWYVRYKDREPFENPDSIWAPYFIEKGWIKKVMKYEYEIQKP